MLNDVGAFVPAAGLARIGNYVASDPAFDSFDAFLAAFQLSRKTFGTLRDADWRELAEVMHRRRPDGRYGFAYDPAIGRAFNEQPATDVDLWHVYDAVAVPTLVVRGETSDILPASAAAEMTRRGPRAELFEVANTGHAPWLRSAEEIDIIRRFLAAA